MRKYNRITAGRTAVGRTALCAVSCILLLLAAACPARALARPEGMEEEAWTKLSDNVIEFDELPDLVEYYNPNYQQVLGQIMPSVDETRTVAADLEKASSDLKKQAKDYEKSTDMQGMVQYMTLTALSDAAKTTSKTFKKTAGSIDIQTRDIRSQTLLSLVNGCQQMFIGYNQALASRELCEAAVELADAAFRSAQTRKDIGMASDNDVLSAQQTLLSAQNQLASLDNTLVSLRQNLYVMTGRPADDSAGIGPVPEPELSRIDTMDPSADIAAALDASYTYKSLRDSVPGGDFDKTGRDRRLAEAEGQLRTQLEGLYQTVLSSRVGYEAAQTALEAAGLTWESSERQYNLGMTGRLQYLQARIAYLQQKMDFDNASMSLTQAILDYEWALRGIIMGGQTEP